MTINEALRMLAGIFTLTSVVLAGFVSLQWLWFTVFISLNLFQSAFTKWCPMMSILKKLGFKEG